MLYFEAFNDIVSLDKNQISQQLKGKCVFPSIVLQISCQQIRKAGCCTKCQSCDLASGSPQPQLQDCFASSLDQPRPSTSGLTSSAAPAGQFQIPLCRLLSESRLSSADGSPVLWRAPTPVSHKQDKQYWARLSGSFPEADRLARRSLLRWLLPWPIRFRIEQIGKQFAVGHQHGPYEQRQQVGKRIRVAPVSRGKNCCNKQELRRDHSFGSYFLSAKTYW